MQITVEAAMAMSIDDKHIEAYKINDSDYGVYHDGTHFG